MAPEIWERRRQQKRRTNGLSMHRPAHMDSSEKEIPGVHELTPEILSSLSHVIELIFPLYVACYIKAWNVRLKIRAIVCLKMSRQRLCPYAPLVCQSDKGICPYRIESANRLEVFDQSIETGGPRE